MAFAVPAGTFSKPHGSCMAGISRLGQEVLEKLCISDTCRTDFMLQLLKCHDKSVRGSVGSHVQVTHCTGASLELEEKVPTLTGQSSFQLCPPWSTLVFHVVSPLVQSFQVLWQLWTLPRPALFEKEGVWQLRRVPIVQSKALLKSIDVIDDTYVQITCIYRSAQCIVYVHSYDYSVITWFRPYLQVHTLLYIHATLDGSAFPFCSRTGRIENKLKPCTFWISPYWRTSTRSTPSLTNKKTMLNRVGSNAY